MMKKTQSQSHEKFMIKTLLSLSPESILLKRISLKPLENILTYFSLHLLG